MYILLYIFAAYAVGLISCEYGFFSYIFIALFTSLVYRIFKTKRFIFNSVIIAFLILSLVNTYYNSKFILKQYINEEAVFTVKIKKQNKINADSDYLSFDASVIDINGRRLKQSENTIVYINKANNTDENSIIQFKGRTADTNFNRNRKMFNYENYLRAKKIGAVIFLQENPTVIKKEYSLINEISINFRNYAERCFYNSLSRENANVILSIILGNVDYLDEGLYDNIKIMGLAHIFAVSGTHIVLMYAVLLKMFKLFYLGRRPSWMIAWIIIWFYGFLIGFPVTVMRALVMFTLLFGSEILYRKYNSVNSICLAALVLTLYNPYWIFDAGFLLSFSAALSLIVYNKYISRHIKTRNEILRAIYLYLFLHLFTLPVVSYYFNYVPFMGIIYNILLLPIFTVILIYGFALLIMNVIFYRFMMVFFDIFDYILYSLRYFVNLTDKVQFNGLSVSSMSTAMIIFYYCMLIVMIYAYTNKNHRENKCGAAILLSFCIINFIFLPFMDVSLYFNVVDAGQGMFTTVKYKDINLIIDCGSTSSSNFGKYTAVPYMVKRGVSNVDGVFISHWDEDHYSGLVELMNSNITIKNVFSSYKSDEIDQVELLHSGDSQKIDDRMKIEILSPEEGYLTDKSNNRSLVILLKYEQDSVLLTGDIESEAEGIVSKYIEHTDILLVPHHGSKTSSTSDFVNSSSPNIAVMSYGKNNYGIPSKDVISRYENKGSNILSTFKHGEINFILKGDKIYYNTYTGQRSDNYYELYFAGIIPNMINFCLLVWIMRSKGENYEL